MITEKSYKLDTYGNLETNLNNEITYVSPVFCKRFNLSGEEMIGRQLKTVMKFDKRTNKKGVFFTLINSVPCLIKIFHQEDKNIIQIMITGDDVSHSELVSFINSMEMKKYKKKTVEHQRYHFEDIIGNSPAMQRVKELASKIATGNSTILLTGESGTGKELFAQAIHGLSSRKSHSFIAVNCVAIPDELFESELFGYEPGAFSGAKKEGKPGKIELAQNGTLFLDEISELSYQAQGKLLRVLQEREVERLGGTTRKQVDIRIIAATNRDLKKMVDKGEFRQDLYYRLYVFELQIPPLRVRKEDILPLTHFFIDYYNRHFDKEVSYIDSTMEEWLLSYEWPGNVRELKACIERGMNIVEKDTLSLDLLYIQTSSNHASSRIASNNNTTLVSLEDIVQQAEMQAIKEALEQTNGDKMLAAQKLKIHVASLYRKIAKYNLKIK
ncbi:sigma-54 interaction domain-containing protein [Oceanobacillus piezotolerans]|nr:sigma 54-interacting transcriptional regulator [Oceanobacillus piezotolerans]